MKSLNFDFQSQFSTSEIIQIFLSFFIIEEYMMPNFWQLAITPILKIW